MATPITIIRDWFRANKKPTQQQFWDTWDSFWHKDEMIPQARIEDLSPSLNLKADKNGTLAFKGSIPDAANLNDYITTGLYHQPLNAYAQNGINYPEATVAGMLQVTFGDTYIYQQYHTFGQVNDIYIRTYYPDPDVPIKWSAWKKLVSNNDLINLKPELVNDFNAPVGFKFLEGYLNAANRPESSEVSWAQGLQVSTNSNPDYINQLVFDQIGDLYSRTKFGGTWNDWKKISGKYDRHPLTYTEIDCNTATEGIHTGILWSNAPVINGISILENIILSSDWISQTFTIIVNGETYKRFRHSGTTWTDWQKILTVSDPSFANKADDSDVLHNTGDETKSGSLIIDGNNRGYYLGNAGNNASILYNSNGNLDITPRAGYNTIFTAGKVGVGTANPAYNFVVSNNGNEGLEVVLGIFPDKSVILLSFDRAGNVYTPMSFDALKYSFKIQSAEAFTIDANGNVGVGISTPGAKLDVNGGVNITDGSLTGKFRHLRSNIITVPSGADRWVKLFTTSSENNLSLKIECNMTSQNSVNGFVIDIRGGYYDSTVPSVRPFIEVTNGTYNERLKEVMVLKEPNRFAVYIKVRSNDDDVVLFWNLDSVDNGEVEVNNSIITPASTSGSFVLPANPFVKANNHGYTQLRNENIGMGTTNPISKLDVNGHINIASGYHLSWGGNYGDNHSVMAGNDTGIYFYPGGGDEKVRFQANGKVGIGKIPEYKLDVSGSIRAEGVIVATADMTVGGTGSFAGEVTVPVGTASSSAVNKSQLDDGLSAKAGSHEIADKFIELTQDYEIQESDFGLSSSITFFIDASADNVTVYLPNAVTDWRTIHFFRMDTSNNGVKLIASHLGGWNGDPNNEIIYLNVLDKQVTTKSFNGIYWYVS